MLSVPVAMGRANEKLVALPTEGEPIIPANMRDVVTGLEGKIAVPRNLSERATKDQESLMCIPDGNRGAIIPGLEVELWDRKFLVGIKGTGARMSMYSDGPSEFAGLPMTQDPVFTSESWFGENPWGAMSEKGCLEDQEVTENADLNGINGFYICPMVRATPLPDQLMKEALSKYWYRRLDRPGPYYQQVRLMPSDVRLFYQSEATLGRKTSGVLNAFKIDSLEDLDHFTDNYISSGIAALTTIPRTIRKNERWGHVALDFADVWLDKDSVIASDGTIFFADIEGLEWVPVRDNEEAEFKMKRHFDRNFYEFMYGLDCLLRHRDQMSRRVPTMEGLRQGVATRLELVIENDPFVEIEASEDHLDVIMKPGLDKFPEVRVRMLDLR